MQGVHLRKYGVQAVINFELYETDGIDLKVDAADGGTDCTIMKDQGAETTCTNDFVDEGTGYSLTLTATEMQAAQITVYIVDSATKVYLDKVLHIETYGNASAMHAMDLDDAVRGGMTALPNAAADAAGGLPISDAGGLDLDTQIGTDIDAILADTANMQPKLGTPAGADMSADLAAVKSDTAAILTDTGTTIPGLIGTPAVDLAADILVIDNFVDDLESRLSAARAGYLDNLNIGENVAGTSEISALNDPTAAVIADAVWDEAIAGHVAVGSFGEEVQAHALSSEISGLENVSTAEVNAEVDTALGDFFTTAAQLVDDIWDEVAGGHVTATTFGKLLADVIEDTGTTIPGLLGTPAADLAADLAAVKSDTGNILTDTGTTIPATLGTPAAASISADILAIDNFVDGIESAIGSPAVTLAADIAAVPTAAENADGLLGRNIAGGSDGGRDVTSSLRRLRNKVSIAASTMTVTEEDDSTSAWTAAIVTASGDPIVSIDPA